MCNNRQAHSSSSSSSRHFEFTSFCSTLRKSLADAPLLDPPLAAALELLERRQASDGLGWFECEVAHIAWNAEDMHAALGAGVLLSLWNAEQAAALQKRSR